MRQSTITAGLKLSSRQSDVDSISRLIKTLEMEENLAFFCVLPSGSSLKCISELLMRCAPNAVVTVEPTGVVFIACDPNSGRLVHIDLRAADMLKFRMYPSPSLPPDESHPAPITSSSSSSSSTPQPGAVAPSFSSASDSSSFHLRSVLECNSLHSVFHHSGCMHVLFTDEKCANIRSATQTEG